MKRFFRHVKWLVVAIFSMGVLAACGIMREPLPATPTPGLVEITADEAAKAIEEEYYGSKYRDNTLHVTGTVSAVYVEDGTVVVEMETTRSLIARAYLASQAGAPKVGDTITLVTKKAREEPDAIAFLDCTILNQ
jgi:hypothetical protein